MRDKIFDRIDYEVRYEDNEALEVNEIAEIILEFSNKFEISSKDVICVFSDNKDNPYELLITVEGDGGLPADTWIDLPSNNQVGVHLNIDFKKRNKKTKENIVKQTAKELGMTYRELAEEIGLSEGSIKRLASAEEVNAQVVKSLELLKEALEYREVKKAITPLRKLLGE